MVIGCTVVYNAYGNDIDRTMGIMNTFAGITSITNCTIILEIMHSNGSDWNLCSKMIEILSPSPSRWCLKRAFSVLEVRLCVKRVAFRCWKWCPLLALLPWPDFSECVTQESNAKRVAMMVHFDCRSSNTRMTHRFRLGKSFDRGIPNLWGFLGCVLSHQLAYKKAESMNAEYLLLFEDDAKPTLTGSNFHKILSQAIKAMPNNFLTLQLGVHTAGHAPLTCRKTIRKLDESDLLQFFLGENVMRCMIFSAISWEFAGCLLNKYERFFLWDLSHQLQWVNYDIQPLFGNPPLVIICLVNDCYESNNWP